MKKILLLILLSIVSLSLLFSEGAMETIESSGDLYGLLDVLDAADKTGTFDSKKENLIVDSYSFNIILSKNVCFITIPEEISFDYREYFIDESNYSEFSISDSYFSDSFLVIKFSSSEDVKLSDRYTTITNFIEKKLTKVELSEYKDNIVNGSNNKLSSDNVVVDKISPSFTLYYYDAFLPRSEEKINYEGLVMDGYLTNSYMLFSLPEGITENNILSFAKNYVLKKSEGFVIKNFYFVNNFIAFDLDVEEETEQKDIFKYFNEIVTSFALYYRETKLTSDVKNFDSSLMAKTEEGDKYSVLPTANNDFLIVEEKKENLSKEEIVVEEKIKDNSLNDSYDIFNSTISFGLEGKFKYYSSDISRYINSGVSLTYFPFRNYLFISDSLLINYYSSFLGNVDYKRFSLNNDVRVGFAYRNKGSITPILYLGLDALLLEHTGDGVTNYVNNNKGEFKPKTDYFVGFGVDINLNKTLSIMGNMFYLLSEKDYRYLVTININL